MEAERMGARDMDNVHGVVEGGSYNVPSVVVRGGDGMSVTGIVSRYALSLVVFVLWERTVARRLDASGETGFCSDFFVQDSMGYGHVPLLFESSCLPSSQSGFAVACEVLFGSPLAFLFVTHTLAYSVHIMARWLRRCRVTWGGGAVGTGCSECMYNTLGRTTMISGLFGRGAKPIIPPSESASKEDSDPEQTQRDKDMQNFLALIAKYFKKIYKPTNNNLRTSSNTRNKNVDTTPRYKNDNPTGQFGNQRAVNVVGARETVGGQIVQQSGIQCFNCKEFDHYAKECRKPKWVKDSTYHKEKMLLCKQAEKGVQLQAEQSDWLADTDEEIDEQELEAHYSYMAKIQEVPNADSGTDSEPLEQQYESISNTCAVEMVDSNVIPDSPDMCDNDIQDDQNDVECDDERVALANLIANLKLDVDENKKIQKQLKKANATLTQELTECKSILAETSRTLGESNSIRDSCLVALQNKQTEFERYKAFNDRTVDYDQLERRLNETLGILALKKLT
ncbi:RNA-directed DNA polymerase, eukaryota [Tanacetum coccineum]